MVLELGTYVLVAAAGMAAAMMVITVFAWWRHWPDIPLFTWVLPAILFKAGISPLLLGRSYAGSGAWTVLADDAQNMTLGWISRLVSLLILIAFLQVNWRRFQRYMRSRFDGTADGGGRRQEYMNLGADQRIMLAATVVFFFASIVAPALFSANPGVSHEYLYLTAICITGIVLDEREKAMAIEWLKIALVGFVAMSLACILVKPDSVLDFSYAQGLLGRIPRFSGLAPHPVAMGMVSLIGGILLILEPFKLRWLQACALTFMAVALFLAQSKLAWMTGAICAGMSWASRHIFLDARSTERERSRRKRTVVGLASMAGVLILLTPFAIGLFPERIDRLLATGEAQSVATGTGRDVIWEVALNEWHRHPVFGYGLDLFDKVYRESVGLMFATHGHNQIVDSLARTGMVGAIGVLVFLGSAAVVLIRMRRRAMGLAGYMFVLLIARSISEVPLILFTYGIESIPIVLMLMTLGRKSAHGSQGGEVPGVPRGALEPSLQTFGKPVVQRPGVAQFSGGRTSIARAVESARTGGTRT